MSKVLNLSEASSLIFGQSNTVIAEITGIPYMTVTSYKYRWNKGLLSAKLQEEIILKFGLQRVDEFRYVLPK